MNKKYLSETILNASIYKSAEPELYYYDDRIQHKSIPVSSTMSKSLKALNTYVKKNIFYDESEEQQEVKNDSAYFSKESSPNYSVSKCDSDNIKSNIFENKEDNLTLPLRNRTSINSDQTTLTDDYKFNKLLENTIINQKNETNPESQLSLSNENKESTLPVAPKRTASFSSKTGKKVLYENGNLKNNDEFLCNVTLRNKTNSLNLQNNNRHTVHDVTEWVNRTDIYPDVYAPLPYSKYF
ncbi:unnamed protein product [Euphydryas editha]|uniref:Exophilin 5 n=1 Tax=Euphydryas editha TaxID=104508 RepID=A0AAU9V296_EUPED|nr:unnamed protein product [Euphydryas editha]